MKHKTIFSTMIIITCILIIFLAIVIGFGIWFLNSDNETEADLQWKRKTINDCINQILSESVTLQMHRTFLKS